jgi:hypothetical protein
MREWRTATTRIPCGSVADCWIKPGELHCVFTQEDWLSAKYRCRQHAGHEPPPEVLAGAESQVERVSPHVPLVPLPVPAGFSSVKHLAEAAERDVKMAQAGERDDD